MIIILITVFIWACLGQFVYDNVFIGMIGHWYQFPIVLTYFVIPAIAVLFVLNKDKK